MDKEDIKKLEIGDFLKGRSGAIYKIISLHKNRIECQVMKPCSKGFNKGVKVNFGPSLLNARLFPIEKKPVQNHPLTSIFK